MGNIDYYNTHAKEYIERTNGLDLSEYYELFLNEIPKSGNILDSACGGGRDSKEFLRRGYRVTAFDASRELASHASQILNQPVANMTFSEMSWSNEFDGIWSSACLLHVPLDHMQTIFVKHIDALKSKGVWYMSFKGGEGEISDEDGRIFTCYSIKSLTSHIRSFPMLNAINIWETIHPITNIRWVNALITKRY